MAAASNWSWVDARLALQVYVLAGSITGGTQLGWPRMDTDASLTLPCECSTTTNQGQQSSG
jgi:hypothetical protein